MSAFSRVFIPILVTVILYSCLGQKKVNKLPLGRIELSLVDTDSSYYVIAPNDTIRYPFASLMLKNNSDSIANFYTVWNMWGHYNYYLEILKNNDTVKVFRKCPYGWDKNYPHFNRLRTGDSMIVYIGLWSDNASHGFDSIPKKLNGIAKIRFVHHLIVGNHRFEDLEFYNGYWLFPKRSKKGSLPPISETPLSKKDSLKLRKIYNEFPKEKITSKDYDVEILDGSFRIIN